MSTQGLGSVTECGLGPGECGFFFGVLTETGDFSALLLRPSLAWRLGADEDKQTDEEEPSLVKSCSL